MATGSSLQASEAIAPADPSASAGSKRSLVLVAGSGRSGTSLFTGILQRLGFYVPRPEVRADDTNPRGFAESQWVVDFHTRLLARAGVQVSDARPAAWSRMADVALDDEVGHQLVDWLRLQYKEADHLVIKDPRLSWFLPLWRRSAETLDVRPRSATVLRHPAAVVESKQRSYGAWQGDVSRTAGWLNQALFTERGTRENPRAFVRYDDLLDDWTGPVARVGDLLDLRVIKDAPAPSIVRVHDFVDRNLSRSQATWEDFEIPTALRELVDHSWQLFSQLAEGRPDSGTILDDLDAARAAYVALYEEAEAIAQSSVAAASRTPARKRDQRGTVLRVAGKVPRPLRERLPLRWRRAAYRAVVRRGSKHRR